jgi:ribose transport system permease protein
MKEESGLKLGTKRVLHTMKNSTAVMVFFVTILITIGVHLMTGNFYTQYNLSTLTRSVSFIIIVGFAQTIVLLTGGIDLSVASVGSIASMVVATLLTTTTTNMYVAILISTMVGLFAGFLNGALIAYLKLTPFIVTLATGEIFKGVVYVISRGMPIIGVPEDAVNLANGMIGGFLPNVAVIMLVLCVILTLILKKTRFGRYIFAIGGNRQAANIVGINTKLVELLVYAISGLLASLGGVLMTLRLASYQASIGANWVMPSITAAVLGGTAMAGGSGGVVGTIVGGLMMGVISVSITLLSVSSYYETIVTGGVVLIAVLIDALRNQRAAKA